MPQNNATASLETDYAKNDVMTGNAGLSELQVNALESKPIYDLIKRIFDLLTSFIAIILVFPFMLIIALLIKADSKGPAIYRHKRVGLRGKEFSIYKFRSMVCTDKPIHEILTQEQMEQYKREYKLDNDPRITKIGRVLRKTSLDELPQFFNILFGQMSFVGPRPVLQEETELYGENRDLLLSVVPGLTGYWQVNGRSNTTYEERIAMELHYISNRSMFLDIIIIMKTVTVVLTQKDAK